VGLLPLLDERDEVMGVVKLFALAGATALISTATFAADFPPAMPKQQAYAPPADTGGWYLRGDVGIGAQNFKSFDFTQTNAATGGAWPASWRIDQKDIKDATIIGAGIGYSWNNWLRFDVTGEYRSDVKFKAAGSYDNGVGSRSFDLYDGDHSAVVALANIYVDLGTWWCLTPFVGAGIGGAYHRTSALTDVGLNTGGVGGSAFGFSNQDHTNWSLAWAAHAGLAYSVTPNLKLELAYRYLNMGNAVTSEVACGAFGCGVIGGGPRAFYTLTNFSSQDFKLGMRWMLQPEQTYSPPLMRKG
jgi:opacity protein-like surface antigen